MSVKQSGLVWELDIEPVDKLMLLALADHADHDGNNVHPGNALLCAKTGLSQPTVTAKLKKFVGDGILIPRTSTTPGRGNKRTFSLDLEGVPRCQYFIDREKLKAASTFQKNGQPRQGPQKVKAASTFPVGQTDEEKVKADEEKVKADEEKVKADANLHDKERARIKPSIEPLNEPSKGEDAPPDFSEIPQSTVTASLPVNQSADLPKVPPQIVQVDASAFEDQVEDIQAALQEIFPALTHWSRPISEMTLFVKELGAPASYVRAWPKWFRTRYSGQVANHFKFSDTFAELAREGLTPDAWLNGSPGSRLIARLAGHKEGRPVPARTSHEVQTLGHWLDDQVKLPTVEQWRASGFTPENFQAFWKATYPTLTPPTKPATIAGYWPAFTAWLKTKSKSPASNKTAPKTEAWYQGVELE